MMLVEQRIRKDVFELGFRRYVGCVCAEEVQEIWGSAYVDLCW